MIEHAVVIAGGGPTGLMLAGELALAGVDVAIVERRASQDLGPWADRVQLMYAEYAGPWELPAIGAVTAPGAVVIRPDGYVAWVGDQTQAGLIDALTTWFGPPAAA
jgi:cation diffusion facilitator CzcD-associated flavoprotein CzcO